MRWGRIATSLLRGARTIAVSRSFINADHRLPIFATQQQQQLYSARRGALYSMEAPIAVAAGDTGNVHVIPSSEAWHNKLAEISSSNSKLAVCDFTATWCGPCKMIAPYFSELSKVFNSVVFLKVDVDQMPDVASEWKVAAMPTFVFISGGKEVHRVVGANRGELQAKLEMLSKATQ